MDAFGDILILLFIRVIFSFPFNDVVEKSGVFPNNNHQLIVDEILGFHC